MKITTESGLTFHDVIYRRSTDYYVAFITCKDKYNRSKYYWGFCTAKDDENQLLKIMEKGANWNGKIDKRKILFYRKL